MCLVKSGAKNVYRKRCRAFGKQKFLDLEINLIRSTLVCTVVERTLMDDFEYLCEFFVRNIQRHYFVVLF